MITCHRFPAPVRSRSCVARALVGVLLLCGTASAQDGAAAPETAPPHRVGPFAVTPEITLRDIGVDSNVYNTVDNPVSDVTFTLAPTIDATARVRRATVSLHSTTDVVYFVQQSSERSLNQSFGAGGQYPFRRMMFGASASYLNTRERPNEEIDARSRRIERSGQASVAVAVAPRLSAQFLGSAAQTAFDADAAFQGVLLGDRLNRTTDTLSAAAHYRLTPLTAIVFTATSAATLFERAPERNGDSRQFLVGVELQRRALISGAATLGRENLTPRSGVMPPFAGLVGNGAILYRLRPTTRIGIEYDRNLYYSYAEVAPYYIRAGASLVARHEVASRWDLEVSAGRYRHNYRYLASVEPSAKADESVISGEVSVTYRAGPRTRVVGAATYQQRDASAGVTGYHSLRFGTSVVYGF